VVRRQNPMRRVRKRTERRAILVDRWGRGEENLL
jgi:hypothetical protein